MEQLVSLDHAFDVFSRFFLCIANVLQLIRFFCFISFLFSGAGWSFINFGLLKYKYSFILGFKPSIVTASRVNDGICDCCDGSDEWAMVAGGACRNNCDELGAAERAERERLEKVVEEGLR